MSTTWRNVLIGAVVLCLVVIGGLLWYIFFKPSPVSPSNTASTTPLSTTAPSIPAPPAQPTHIIQNGQYYSVDMQYPSATPLVTTAGDKANMTALEALKNFSETTIQSFLTNGKFDTLTPSQASDEGLGPNQKFTLSDGYTAYAGAHTISYVFNIYEITLGAHPLTTFQTFTFDSKTGQNLSLSDLFLPGSNYLSLLSSLSRTSLTKEEGANADTTFINAGTTPDMKNFQDFSIDGSNLLLIFPPYKVGPGALGTQTIRIPLSQLSSVLTADYR